MCAHARSSHLERIAFTRLRIIDNVPSVPVEANVSGEHRRILSAGLRIRNNPNDFLTCRAIVITHHQDHLSVVWTLRGRPVRYSPFSRDSRLKFVGRKSFRTEPPSPRRTPFPTISLSKKKKTYERSNAFARWYVRVRFIT